MRYYSSISCDKRPVIHNENGDLYVLSMKRRLKNKVVLKLDLGNSHGHDCDLDVPRTHSCYTIMHFVASIG